jgi:branched-chain amino acid aminotransferase
MTTPLPILKPSEWFDRHNAFAKGRTYAAMYSSVVGGIVREPGSMLVPLDDHLVHRGDGVFEALRIHSRAIFDLDAHLQRLESSAAAIRLPLPFALAEIRHILIETSAAANLSEGTLRLFVSRGPGSFSVSPADTVGSQLYVVVTGLQTPSKAAYENGVKVILAKTAQKPHPFAKIKSCNYLQNVMMKLESLDAGADFAVGVTPEGYLAEGPTENFFLIDKDNNFVYPKFDYTLAGTTLIRVAALAQTLVAQGVLRNVELEISP